MYGIPRLGELLVQMGKITPEQLKEALDIQSTTGRRLGETLIELGYITPDDYYEAQAQQYEVPYEPLNEPTIEAIQPLAKLIPSQLANRYFMVPLKQEGDLLWVAMVEPNNVEALDAISRHTGKRLRVFYSPAERVLRALHLLYGVPQEAFETPTPVQEQEEIEDLSEVCESIHQPPIIRLVNTILAEAVDRGASDIHFEPSETRLQVRARIDGVLYTIRSVPRSLQMPVLARVKLMAEMDIADRRRAQDGRFTMRFEDRAIDARVSSLPTVFGERIVIRLLDRSQSLKTLDQLGMPAELEQRLLDLASQPWGMILVTGPTGSGKSTTLYALLQSLRSERRNILTCEDPVEYTIEGIGQSQVNEKAGLTFANQLRAILRQDPDVVLVGEIRDTETAEIACRAAMTGHLVLSTLHTNDATSAPARLLDMGIPHFLINSALTGVLAQRLVRRLCPYCKQEVQVSPQELGIPWGEEPIQVYEPKGCSACNNIGYRGRVGLYELFLITEPIRRLIAQSADSEQIRAQCPPNTLLTMEADARQKVLAGITSLEEVLAQLNLYRSVHPQAA